MSVIKTNAVRLLEQKNIPYTLYPYETEDGQNDGLSVAEKTGVEPERVFKTLVAQGASRQYYVFLVPVLEELHLKKAAQACGEKKIDMIPMKELLPLTGYVKGGCSPVGMKKKFRTFIDQSGDNFEEILVSGGKVGLQIGLHPKDLVIITEARWADICHGG